MNRSLDAVILRYVGYTLLFLLTCYLIYMVKGTLPLFLIGCLLAYCIEPLIRRLVARGYSRRGAVGYMFVIFLLLLGLALALLASAWQQGQSLVTRFPEFQTRITEIANQGQERLDKARVPQDVKKSVRDAVTDAKTRAPQLVKNAAAWMIGAVPGLGIMLIVLPVVTFWFMLEMDALRLRLLMLVPPNYRRDVTDMGNSINEMLGRYVRGQMVICGLFGLFCTISFYVLHFAYGMEYPLVLGLVAAVAYAVPYVGMASIAAAAALIAYVTSHSPLPCALIAVGCCVLSNLILDYAIAPRVLGQGVGLHPLMVIFALLSGAEIGGIFGMILAVPMFAAMRVVAIYIFPQLTSPLPTTAPPGAGTSQAGSTSELMEQVGTAQRSLTVPDLPA